MSSLGISLAILVIVGVGGVAFYNFWLMRGHSRSLTNLLIDELDAPGAGRKRAEPSLDGDDGPQPDGALIRQAAPSVRWIDTPGGESLRDEPSFGDWRGGGPTRTAAASSPGAQPRRHDPSGMPDAGAAGAGMQRESAPSMLGPAAADGLDARQAAGDTATPSPSLAGSPGLAASPVHSMAAAEPTLPRTAPAGRPGVLVTDRERQADAAPRPTEEGRSRDVVARESAGEPFVTDRGDAAIHSAADEAGPPAAAQAARDEALASGETPAVAPADRMTAQAVPAGPSAFAQAHTPRPQETPARSPAPDTPARSPVTDAPEHVRPEAVPAPPAESRAHAGSIAAPSPALAEMPGRAASAVPGADDDDAGVPGRPPSDAFHLEVLLKFEGAVPGARLGRLTREMHRVGAKPIELVARHVLSDGDRCFETVRESMPYDALLCRLLLINRQGPLNAMEYSEFAGHLQRLGEELEVLVDIPDMADVLARARRLDESVGDLDAQIAVNVEVPEAIAPDMFARVAQRLGLHEQTNERFVRLDEHSEPVFSAALTEQAGRIVLLLDVPRVRSEGQPIREVIETAWKFAQAFEGRMVDDAGQPIDNALFERIEHQLDTLYHALDANGLRAGSALARRVFNL